MVKDPKCDSMLTELVDNVLGGRNVDKQTVDARAIVKELGTRLDEFKPCARGAHGYESRRIQVHCARKQQGDPRGGDTVVTVCVVHDMRDLVGWVLDAKGIKCPRLWDANRLKEPRALTH
jgi:hypothetical protein